MSSSPRRGSPRHGAGSPSKATNTTNPAAATATFSPRRPATQRTGSNDAHTPRLVTVTPVVNHTLGPNGESPPDTASSGSHGRAGGAGSEESGNPHVRAIQSRVADLVRRYDEEMADQSNSNDDDDSSRLVVPTRWRVGDLLMATHSSLAKTSSRTERSMLADFADDAEVATAMGEGEETFSLVLEQATQKAAQMKAMLAKTLQVVQQLQRNDDADDATAAFEQDAAGSHHKLRELKITVEALHKEKSMVLAQLHEHVKSHKEMVAVIEDQSQELRKAQIAIACKQDELKAVRDDYGFRLTDLQKTNETAQQTVAMWRDKYQATLKTLGENEQRVAELEQRVHAEGDEVVQHDFILRAKNSELEKYKDRLRESEAALREATVEAAKMAEVASAKTSGGEVRVKTSDKQRHEFETKIRQHEATIRDLQRRLTELTTSHSTFEADNKELARIVRELQTTAQDAEAAPVVSPTPRLASGLSPSFRLSLRSMSIQNKRRASSINSGPRRRDSLPRDDLSTDSDDANDDSDAIAERDDQALNDAVLQVVTAVFPPRVSAMESQSDETIDRSIKQYEADPTNSPLAPVMEDDATTVRRLTATVIVDQPPPPTASSSVDTSCSSRSETESLPGLSDLGRLQLAHTEQLARLKKQYVTGLLEYKKLIIEQYERRQMEIQQQHRMEIENLILVVQDKFKRELERRGEHVQQAKESLKLLYRTLQSNDASGGRHGLGSFAKEGEGDPTDPDNHEGSRDDRVDEAAPLKSMLRAAVFAMSSSKDRNSQASDDIKRLCEAMRTSKCTPRNSVVSAANKKEVDWAAFLQTMRANRNGYTRPETTARASVTPAVHVACQVDERDFVIFDLKGLRGNHVPPANLDGYVLPSLALLTRDHHASGDDDNSPRRVQHHRKNGSLDGVVYLHEGALLSDEIVTELRAVLPFLPPGAYFLSGALRHQLQLEMLRFYAELGKRHGEKPHHRQQQLPPPQQLPHHQQREETVEIMVGSPRDTPFLRRKAVESVERRQRLSNGGLAMLQPPVASSTSTSTSIAAGFVSAAMATSSLSHVRHYRR